MHPLERALVRTVSWLVPALAASLALLAVPTTDDPFGLFLLQLSVIVVFGVALAVQLSRLVGEASVEWFTGSSWSPATKRLAAASTIVALDTFAVGLLTLASSAALRLEPSLQFLQALSALDIAWTGAAIVIGSFMKWGVRAAWTGGALLGVLCVYSIWRYLDVVGFTAEGGWLVSGADLLAYVIPFDILAAAVAVTLLLVGAQSGRVTEHAKLQS